MNPAARVRFPGLDSLRFLAASFVVLGHIPLNQTSVGLPHPSSGAFFFRGSPAVSFFFTLSGFLITYLLLDEQEQTGTIGVRRFYLRRVCRIWPLYFAVVFAGLFFYNALLPRLGIAYRVEYRLSLALVLYGALLPNLMNSLYTVGGILNPLWSIGVEEQFYLFWAPAVKRFRRYLPIACWAVLFASFTLFCLSRLDVFGPYRAKGFVGQLRFHYMAAGALCAWALRERREAFLRWAPFANRALQLVLLLLLLDFYLATLLHWGWFGDEVLQLTLYPWLIVEVAVNPRHIVRLGNRATEYLGTISYGIYMLHMPAVYATSAAFKATGWAQLPLPLYLAAYYTIAFGLTFLLAHLSYRLFELPFLRLKDRRLAPPGPLPVPASFAGVAEGCMNLPVARRSALRHAVHRLKETAPHLFIALRTLRYLVRAERPDPVTARILSSLCGDDLRVLAGPFQGMRFIPFASGSGLLPKIVGSYEMEVHPAVAASLVRTYLRVVNVGCGEGYYSVGYARAMPAAIVHAFDVDILARQRLRRLARLNGVASRIRVAARCGHRELAALAGRDCLLICDCEGGEKELLDPIQAPLLATTDILVELHDFVDPSISSTLQERFRATHEIEILPMMERDVPRTRLPEGLRPEERGLAIWEGRPTGMEWAWMRTRSR